jgi:hypothetical protein
MIQFRVDRGKEELYSRYLIPTLGHNSGGSVHSRGERHSAL